MKDEILEEVWRNREALLIEQNGNLDSYVAHLKKAEKFSKRKVVSFEGTKAKTGYWGRTSSQHRKAALAKN